MSYFVYGECMNIAAKWSYLESVYFAFETITAIGYGDLPFEGEDLMAFGAVYMICTVCVTTIFIEKLGKLLYEFLLRTICLCHFYFIFFHCMFSCSTVVDDG